MFTGIIQHVARVESVSPTPSGLRLVVDPLGWDHHPMPGDSIASNGVCLTLVDPIENHDGRFTFDAIPETLAKTTLAIWQPGQRINLERALRMGDTLDGHQVQGHVDGTGEVLGVGGDDGFRVRVALAPDLMRYMIPKGSVCLEGVSLTIADLDAGAGWIEVALIPETLARTNLGDRQPGDRINVECDVMVKTIVHTMRHLNASPGDPVD